MSGVWVSIHINIYTYIQPQILLTKMADFNEVLKNTLSQHDQLREPAEKFIADMLASNPVWLCMSFVQAACSGPDIEIRQVAAILFRRYSNYTSDPKLAFWQNVDSVSQEACKTALLTALAAEPDASVRRALADAVSSLAKHLSYLAEEEREKNPGVEQPHYWQAILEQLWACSQNDNPGLRETAFRIFGDVPAIFGNDLEKYMGPVKNLLLAGLNDKDNLGVRVAASSALSSYINSLEPKDQSSFSDTVPVLLHIIQDALIQNEEEQATFVLESLMELAEGCPKVLKTSLHMIIPAMAQIGAKDDLESMTRRSAIEVVLIVCETRPQMARKFPQMVTDILPILFQFCREIDDADETWSTEDSVYVQDEDSNATYGEQSLDRVACALKGEAIMNTAFQLILQLLQSPEWQDRVAGLVGIGAIAEGCYDQLKDHLTEVIQQVVPCLQDPSLRVRFAACNTVGQLAIDFKPDDGKESTTCFQTMFHAQVVPALYTVLDIQGHPRVQAHGAAALMNFVEHLSKEHLQTYLDDLLVRLRGMLASPYRIVQEHAVTAIATVADSSQIHFRDYYGHFMPSLKGILLSTHGHKDFRLLRGKTMECISLIGLAVGKTVFEVDAREVMTHLFQTQANMEPDDPQVSYMLAAWARFCEILGEDFLPYLPVVMPPLLQSLKLETDYVVLEDEADLPETEDPANWELHELDNDKRIGIKTSVLEEKRFACEMVRIYVEHLKGGFEAYIGEVATIMLPLLRFMFDDPIRSVAATTLPLLISAAWSSERLGKGPALQLWQQSCEALLGGLEKEDELEVTSYFFEAFKDCVEIVAYENLPADALVRLCRVIVKHLTEYQARVEARIKQRSEDEDHDRDAENDLVMEELEEMQVIREIANVMHTLFTQFQSNLLPMFDTLYPYFVNMLAQERCATDHQWALCIFDDLIESCGPDSFRYAEHFAPQMLFYLKSTSPEVRQAAAYGLGVMSLKGGSAYIDICKQGLSSLVEAIQAADSRSYGNIEACENAISAVVKICRNEAMGIPSEQAVPLILSWLPVTEDEEETDYIYTYLLELLESNNAVIYSEASLRKTIEVLGTVLNTGLAPVESPLGSRISIDLKNLRAKIGANFDAIYGSLDPICQGNIQAGLQYASTAEAAQSQ